VTNTQTDHAPTSVAVACIRHCVRRHGPLRHISARNHRLRRLDLLAYLQFRHRCRIEIGLRYRSITSRASGYLTPVWRLAMTTTTTTRARSSTVSSTAVTVVQPSHQSTVTWLGDIVTVRSCRWGAGRAALTWNDSTSPASTTAPTPSDVTIYYYCFITVFIWARATLITRFDDRYAVAKFYKF